mmetsp:Transcript_15585/g.37189  ORF Transcript_15585/g.37189 Transcript_15585/m.37189 type:complete len:658 (+) Transcript_15585:102-2075(+)
MHKRGFWSTRCKQCFREQKICTCSSSASSPPKQPLSPANRDLEPPERPRGKRTPTSGSRCRSTTSSSLDTEESGTKIQKMEDEKDRFSAMALNTPPTSKMQPSTTTTTSSPGVVSPRDEARKMNTGRPSVNVYQSTGPQGDKPPEQTSEAPADVDLASSTERQEEQMSATADAPMPDAEPQPEAAASPKAKPNPNNPLRKLTVNLLQTYKGINDVYYAKKRRQQQQAGASGKKNATTFNDGYDDENGDYIPRLGEEIAGRYTIRETKPLGKGSFGVVIKALDLETKENVALKIIKNKKAFHDQALIELQLLYRFKDMGEDVLDNYNIVALRDHFTWRNHKCLVFELLNLSLYDLLKRTRHQVHHTRSHLFDITSQGVSLNLVRKFAIQMLASLHLLSRSGIMHCDLKPENVLLRNGISCQIKVIDFGSSCREDRKMYDYIQSRFYRAPEVLLQQKFGVPIDMWSLGCILVEMHTGQPVFNGRNQCEQMKRIVEVLGYPPPEMIAGAGVKSKVAQMFKTEGGSVHMTYGAPGSFTKGEKVSPSIRPLSETIGVTTGGPGGRRRGEMGHDQHNYELFLDLVQRMLTYDPKKRITPTMAAKHPFLRADTSGTGAQTRPQSADAAAGPPTPQHATGTPRSPQRTDIGLQVHPKDLAGDRPY